MKRQRRSRSGSRHRPQRATCYSEVILVGCSSVDDMWIYRKLTLSPLGPKTPLLTHAARFALTRKGANRG